MMIKKLFALFLMLLWPSLSMAQTETITHGSLAIDRAVMRAALPGSKVTAAYMTITNNGAEADRLIGVEFSGAKKSEIHSMEMDGGVMKMRPVDSGLEIKPGESVTLKQGGLHLMFMGLTERPADGETRTLTLIFQKSGSVTITLPVKMMMDSHKTSS